ncbi:hypothetical protein K2F54_18800 [Cryobacterium sp. 1639]|uniref:hypothetical protein n=1 Tax=Cryobacterium inferilacus TaxID=2866629 RepID=UPI001C72FDB0|nr:hypothetical protein [Cryobacterium sp. 1639]MBX0302010.1 hypothetical protein [Cryobacterium sp. 1639]
MISPWTPPGADVAAVAAALSQAERDRADAAAERTRAGEELAASQLLFAQADRRDREAQESAEQSSTGPAGLVSEEFDDIIRRNSDLRESGVSAAERERGSQEYDSAERRHRFAASLEDKGIDQKTIAARLLAEDENAQHPRQAVASWHGGAAKIRKSKSTSAQQRTRGGLST